MSEASSRLSVSSSPAAGSSSMITDGPDATGAGDADEAAATVRQLVGVLVEVRLELELAGSRATAVEGRVVTAGPEQVGDPRRRRRWSSAPARMFSSTLTSSNSSRDWNERRSPRRARLVGRPPVDRTSPRRHPRLPWASRSR